MANWTAQRDRLVEELRREGIQDRRVLSAFSRIPRHEFVPRAARQRAYLDMALPLAEGQTISQPYTIAVMLEALRLRPGLKVLEVGCASGYSAALMGVLVGAKGRVVSLEIIPALVRRARRNLQKVGCRNVTILQGDGSLGYPPKAPFDRIVVMAACPRIPSVLLEQLKGGGIIVAPVDAGEGQEMVKVTKMRAGLKEERLGRFLFVPLRGKYGYPP